jgi:hypothetical protein
MKKMRILLLSSTLIVFLSILGARSSYARPSPMNASAVWDASSTLAQAEQAPYPRLSHSTWGGAVMDWYVKFDLVDNNANNNPDWARQLKTLKPGIKIVVTRDFNQGISGHLQGADEWKVKSSQGVVCPLYFEEDAFFNYTDFAPLRQTEYGTMRYNEYIAHWMTDPKNIDLSVFDGVQTDGLWDAWHGGLAPCNTDIDLDGNGLNDFTESGKGRDWVDAQLHQGALKVIRLLRGRLDSIRPELLLIINSGGPHLWGREHTNGFMHEHFTGAFGFDWLKGQYDTWVRESAQPSTPIMVADTLGGTPISPPRNDFQLMRYGFGISLLTGAYYDFSDDGGWHYFLKYFDEFDIKLGHAAGPAQKTASGAWVRFFDHGMVIVNGSDTESITVTVDEVKGLAGYRPGSSGTYWRFAGGQDLAVNGAESMNNGLPFDVAHPITLNLRQALGEVGGYLQPTVADAVVLVREPRTVVSEILIDNWISGTSPGSPSPAENRERDMPGFLQATDCNQGSQYYTVRCAIYQDPNTSPPDEPLLSPPFAKAEGGTSAKASYVPNIGVPGQYEVFEWHPKLAQGGAASAVLHRITYDGGTQDVHVDQSLRAGRWNSLGVYSFRAGTAGNVSILAEGAEGTVIADAIKFAYLGDGPLASFADVPSSHWAYDDIEMLYREGYVAGCSAEPPLYCPEATMTRAESAVLIERGVHGAGYLPPDPAEQIFADVPLWEWFAKWATGLWEDGYTAGCGLDPLIYCPLQEHSRAEATVFFLRMLHGKDYEPTEVADLPYIDVAEGSWYRRWVGAAYGEGLIQECEDLGDRGDDLFRPQEGLRRAEAACMMIRAKGLAGQGS